MTVLPTPEVTVSKKQRTVRVGCKPYQFVRGNGLTDCDNCAIRIFNRCHLTPCTSVARIDKKEGYYKELSTTPRTRRIG